MVAALAAWLCAEDRSLTPDQVAAMLRAGAQDLAPAGHDRSTGAGMVQARGALAARPPAAD